MGIFLFLWPPNKPCSKHPKRMCVSFLFFFFLLYNIVLVLPYIHMHPPQVYTCSQSWTTPLPPPVFSGATMIWSLLIAIHWSHLEGVPSSFLNSQHRFSDFLLSMCTSHKVPRLLVKIWETLVYTESASTLFQLNLFSWNLSLNFLTLTLPPHPQTETALQVGNFPVASLSGCRSLEHPVVPPLSPSFQLSCFVLCDTMLESSNTSYDTNLHTLQLSTYAHAPPEDDTPLCTPRDRSSERLPNNE